MSYTEKDPVRVAAGYKAALKNPHVSEEAKQHAADALDNMTEDAPKMTDHSERAQVGDDPYATRVMAGYKATISNPKTSDEAKVHAREVLEGDAPAPSLVPEAQHDAEVHEHRVLAGYKAALKNPRVSEEAKEHAEEVLEEHGATA